MEIRFTTSVIKATDFMVRLTVNGKSVVPKDASYETTGQVLGPKQRHK